MTVAATDSNDNEASWSNYGPCVDIWAPGVGVLSTKNGGGTTTYSGTSMASPHDAGGGALYLSNNTGEVLAYPLIVIRIEKKFADVAFLPAIPVAAHSAVLP